MNYLSKMICVLALISFSGCQEFLEETPRTFTNPKTLMQSRAGIEQAVNGIYNPTHILYTLRDVHLMYGITTDESWAPPFLTGERYELMAYKFNADNPVIADTYTAYVTAINRANMVIDNIPPVGTLGIANEKRFLDYKKGEALFLRAWYYFKHMSTFGSVPLITSFNDFDLYPSNSTIPEIYKQIVADLLEAEKLLPGWKDDIAESGRASRGAAKSLLGMVYLTRATSEAKEGNDFQLAVAKLKEVIDHEGYDLWDNYADAFLPVNKNQKEDIFSQQAEANTSFPSQMYTEFVPNPAPSGAARGYARIAVSKVIFDTYPENDKRLGVYVTGEYFVRTTGQVAHSNYNFNEKYLDPVNGPNSYNNHGTNMPLIRYADVLLCYSEAVNAANNGPNSEAYYGINKVRARAGIAPLSGLNKETFFEEIVMERARELFCEGIRWFDLKRWGLLKRAENRGESGVNIDDVQVELPKHNVFPFPQAELDANPNLRQNPGY